MEITKELAEKLGITKEGATEQDIIDAFEKNKGSAEIEKLKQDNVKQKKLLDERNSEIAEMKKAANANKTDAEKQQEHVAELETEIAKLKKENQHNAIVKQYLSKGFSEDEASKIAEAALNNNFDEVANITGEHIKKEKEATKAEVLKDTKHPQGGGDPNDGSLFTKENFRAGKLSVEQLEKLKAENPVKYDEITSK